MARNRLAVAADEAEVLEDRGRNKVIGQLALQSGESPAQTDDETELGRFFTTIGDAPGDSLVHVYLQLPGAKEARVWTGKPGDFDLARVARDFGSGEYRVKLYTATERGNLGIALNKVVTHILSPDEERDLKRRREMKDDAPATGVTLEAVRAMIQETMRAAQPAPTSGLGALKEMVEVIRPLIGGAPAASSDPMIAMRNTIELMKLINDERPSKASGAGGYDLLNTVISKFGPSLLDTVKATATAQAQAAAATPRPALPQPAATVGDQPQPSPEEIASMNRLSMGLNFLCSQAASDGDAATYAEVVMDSVPEADLKGMLAAPDWIDQLARFAPAVKQHAPWFAQLKTAIEAAWADPEQG